MATCLCKIYTVKKKSVTKCPNLSETNEQGSPEGCKLDNVAISNSEVSECEIAESDSESTNISSSEPENDVSLTSDEECIIASTDHGKTLFLPHKCI